MAGTGWNVLGGVSPGPWQRKYKLVFVVLLVILSVQLLLGYQSNKLDEQRDGNSGETGGAAFAHLSGGSLLPVDDDDSQSSNSNHKHPGKEDDFLRIISSNGGEKNTKETKTNTGAACDVQSRDALSAINRARTDECKRQIQDTVCAIESGTFYAHQLTSRCPRGSFSRGRSLGCFQDDQTKRLLDGYYVNNKGTNSHRKCIEICLQSGFTYAGVQYGNECFCGNSAPPSTAKLADSSCTMKCPVEEEEGGRENCGGYFTMNVFETGISKFAAQTAELIPKQGDTRAKVVFLLTLNGRALRQVKRLIRALYSTNHFFYIHVDSRQDYLFRELSRLEADLPNVRLTRRRFSTIWGGASLLQMLLSCMTELLGDAHRDWHWDFVINLSESDFPVKRLDRLVDFLTANKGRNFVKSHGRETQRFVQKQGLDKTFVECDMHMWRVGDRHLPLGIQVDGGSDWVALDRRFVEFVVEGEREGDPLITGLLQIFRHTLLPAESFFHTTLRNSEFCGTYVDNNLHFTNWKRKLGCKCQYRHVVDWCGCSPNDFRGEDWVRLEGTEAKQLFFARKFEPIISQVVVQRLEEWMFGAGVTTVENYRSYWQSVYHHLDTSPKADDGLVTLATSLIRMSMRSHFEGIWGERERAELLEGVQLIEVTYLMEEDRFKGFLVRYRVESRGNRSSYEFEFLTKATQQVQTNKKSRFAQRLSVLEVSTEFDQKEQRARNYAKAMGPFAEPVVVWQLRKRRDGTAEKVEQMANVTAIWIDPVGNIAEVTEVALDDQPNLIYFSKSNPIHPLQPGVWTVKLLQRGTAVAQVKYLIVPLEYLNQRRITAAKARIVNRGTENGLSYGNGKEWEGHLLPREDRVELMRVAEGHAERFGGELEQWIDRLVKNFYLIHEYCVVVVRDAIVDSGAGEEKESRFNWHRELHENGGRFERCSQTQWSSLAPDPKSDIGSGFVGAGGSPEGGNNVDL